MARRLDHVGNPPRPTFDRAGLHTPVPLDDFDWGSDSDHHALFPAGATDVFIHDGSQLASSGTHCVAGDMQPKGAFETFFSQGQPVAGEERHQASHHSSTAQSNFDLWQPHPTPADHGSRPRLAVIGGTAWMLTATTEMNQHVLYDYATSTDLLMQNLTMIVGNPSQRCFANAPWRAFAEPLHCHADNTC